MNITTLPPSSAPAARINPSTSTTANTSNFASVLKDKFNTDATLTNTRVVTEPPLANSNERLARQRSFQDMVHASSPEEADKIAKNFAYADNTCGGGMGGGLDMSGLLPGGDGIIRYAGSGEPVTAESKAYFNKQEASFRRERINIYESEMAKGTPPADVYDKLVAAMGNQPARYRAMMNWDVSAIAATSVSGFGGILKDKLNAGTYITYSQTATPDAKLVESPRIPSISPETSRLYATDRKTASTVQDNPLLNRGMREFAHMLHGNQETAAKVAKEFAYENHNASGNIGGLLDISGLMPGGDGVLRYSGSGEPVTEESKAYFAKEEARFLRERIQIYESETGKGTPPADIYDKLVTAMDNQPVRYRMMMGWPASDSQS